MAGFICDRLLVVMTDQGVGATKEAYNFYWTRPRLKKYQGDVDKRIRENEDYADLKPILEEQ